MVSATVLETAVATETSTCHKPSQRQFYPPHMWKQKEQPVKFDQRNHPWSYRSDSPQKGTITPAKIFWCYKRLQKDAFSRKKILPIYILTKVCPGFQDSVWPRPFIINLSTVFTPAVELYRLRTAMGTGKKSPKRPSSISSDFISIFSWKHQTCWCYINYILYIYIIWKYKSCETAIIDGNSHFVSPHGISGFCTNRTSKVGQRLGNTSTITIARHSTNGKFLFENPAFFL